MFRVEGKSGTITFDFSGKDTLDTALFFQELSSRLEEASSSGVSFLVISISGFRAKDNLKNFLTGDVRKSFQEAEKAVHFLLSMKIPLIGILRGFICGPILEPVLFLDFPIASRTTSFSSLMLEKGYMPQMGMLTNLSNLIGMHALYHFILYGTDASSKNDIARSILHATVREGELDAECASLLRMLSKKDAYSMRLIKELSFHNRNLSLDDADLLERYSFALCFTKHNVKEKIDRFFGKKGIART